jgi:glycosyltransferase involved in cell wall biosynthesis
MKVLIDHQNPFLLMHGGFQIQIEQTKEALEKIGIDVEYLRWWDAAQSGDVIHFFGRPDLAYIRFAQQKGFKFVMSQLLTGLGSRSPAACRAQRMVMDLSRIILPRLGGHLAWDSYKMADASIALTAHEAHLMKYIFRAPPEKVHVVPNGVEDAFLQSQPAKRGPWLICTATIADRKRVVELAVAAVQAKTPVWIIGKAYSESDAYAVRFLQLARQHKDIVRYEGPIDDRVKMAATYREARGFVLLSTMESLSLSALEAAASECPILLSDLPWARTVFHDTVSYCPVTQDAARTASALRQFYDAAPSLKPSPRPLGWVDVAKQLKAVYEAAHKTSR